MDDMTERMAEIRARVEAAATNEAALLMLHQAAPADLLYLLDGLTALAAKYATAQAHLYALTDSLDKQAALRALGRAALALEQAERAAEAWRCSPAPTLAEGTARHEARERASQAYQAALSAAMKGGEGK